MFAFLLSTNIENDRERARFPFDLSDLDIWQMTFLFTFFVIYHGRWTSHVSWLFHNSHRQVLRFMGSDKLSFSSSDIVECFINIFRRLLIKLPFVAFFDCLIFLLFLLSYIHVLRNFLFYSINIWLSLIFKYHWATHCTIETAEQNFWYLPGN